MIIDDTFLIQVYATVLVGVLIFLTLERAFEYKDPFEKKSREILDKRNTAFNERSDLRIMRAMHMSERERNVMLKPSLKEDKDAQTKYEEKLMLINTELATTEEEIKGLTDELHSRGMRYKQRLDRYKSLKSEEDMLTVSTVILLVSSIIVLLIGSIIELYPLPQGMPPAARIISIVLFSIGIILLVRSVYLHGKVIE